MYVYYVTNLLKFWCAEKKLSLTTKTLYLSLFLFLTINYIYISFFKNKISLVCSQYNLLERGVVVSGN
jgi:hypothetical protein